MNEQILKVYNVPSMLPELKPTLLKSKLSSNQSGDLHRYSKWLNYERSESSSRVWKQKGNDPEYNYSPFEFNLSIDTKMIDTVIQDLPLQEIPSNLSDNLVISFWNKRELIKFNFALDEKFVERRLVQTSTTFDSVHSILRGIVIDLLCYDLNLGSFKNTNANETI